MFYRKTGLGKKLNEERAIRRAARDDCICQPGSAHGFRNKVACLGYRNLAGLNVVNDLLITRQCPNEEGVTH